eukprot:2319937-Rhodomonas_salina.1
MQSVIHSYEGGFANQDRHQPRIIYQPLRVVVGSEDKAVSSNSISNMQQETAINNTMQESALLGIHAAVFQDFCEILGLDGEMSGLGAQEKIKALTTSSGLSAFAQMRSSDSPFACYICKATVILSYSFKCKLKDIWSVVGSSNPEAVVWFDLLSAPQNNTALKPFGWWARDVFEGVKEIGELHMMLTHVEDPVPFSSSWCMFELYICAEMGCKFELVMTADVRNAFLKSVREQPEHFYSKISAVRFAKCQSENEEERKRIGEVVEERGGFVAGKVDE